jgi:hypothetical protein
VKIKEWIGPVVGSLLFACAALLLILEGVRAATTFAFACMVLLAVGMWVVKSWSAIRRVFGYISLALLYGLAGTICVVVVIGVVELLVAAGVVGAMLVIIAATLVFIARMLYTISKEVGLNVR